MCDKIIQNEIKRAAAQMMSFGGIDALNITRIAEQCGISRTTFYVYYKSIDELLCDIVRTELERLTDECMKIDDEYESVRHYIVRCVEFFPIMRKIAGTKHYENFARTVSGINQMYIRAIIDKRNLSISTKQALFFSEFFSAGLTAYFF